MGRCFQYHEEMDVCWINVRWTAHLFPYVLLAGFAVCAAGQSSSAPSSSSPSSSSKDHHAATTRKIPHNDAPVDPGTLGDNLYSNKSFGFSCKIPVGWVLRTEEMNSSEESSDAPSEKSLPQGAQGNTEAKTGRVLLATFSRPPEARGDEINSSIVIAAESSAAYPGLKDAAQYFGPLIEVTKAQGFTMEENPYEIAIGAAHLVRGDFHKDAGSRVMRQSTLVMLAHGWVVSITVLAGTDDDLEDLIDGLSFAATPKVRQP